MYSVGIALLLRPFILFSFLAAATGARAEPVPLSNDELKATVAGSIVEIDTPLGTTVPMKFGSDGLVSAEAGVLAPVLGSAKDRGRWWVEDDKLCTKWFRWFDAGVRCLTIAREGARIHWRKIDDGETGTGTLVNWTEPKAKQKPEPKSAVVAKADPPVEKSKPAAAPEPEKRATRLAGPQREVPTEPAASAPTSAPPKPAPAPKPEPTVVVRADVSTSSIDSLDEGPTMRFGGAGLLEASERVGASAKAPEPVATSAETSPTVAKLPAVETTAPAKAEKKAAPQQQASLQAGAQKKQTAQKRTASKKERKPDVSTSSARSVALYRVTGVHRYDVLNVRRGPSEQHPQIASIPPTGRDVEITGQCRADWCPIRYGNVTGWVNSFYLAEDAPIQGSASRVYVAKP